MNNTYEGEPPVLQVLGSKKINTSKNDDNQKSTERYRLLLSDGKNLQSFAMLATNLNELVHNDELSDYTIIRLKDKTVSTVNKGAPGNERYILNILNLSTRHFLIRYILFAKQKSSGCHRHRSVAQRKRSASQNWSTSKHD